MKIKKEKKNTITSFVVALDNNHKACTIICCIAVARVQTYTLPNSINVVWCHIKPTFTPLSYPLKTYNTQNCANSKASASHRCDFGPPLFRENMLQRSIKEIKLFPFFLLTPGSSLKQRRVMRVHLLSSMHCTKLSWHNRKFTCNPRPGGQISVGMAKQRQCMKACIRLVLFYRANHDWSSLPALSLFHFLSELRVDTSQWPHLLLSNCS